MCFWVSRFEIYQDGTMIRACSNQMCDSCHWVIYHPVRISQSTIQSSPRIRASRHLFLKGPERARVAQVLEPAHVSRITKSLDLSITPLTNPIMLLRTKYFVEIS